LVINIRPNFLKLFISKDVVSMLMILCQFLRVNDMMLLFFLSGTIIAFKNTIFRQRLSDREYPSSAFNFLIKKNI